MRRAWCCSRVKELEAETVEVGEFRGEADEDERGEVEREEGGVRLELGVVGGEKEPAHAVVWSVGDRLK